MSGHPPCGVCSPDSCRPSWLYVAHNHTLGLVKIGKSVNVSARFIGYRKEAGHDIRVVATAQPSCDFMIVVFETAALALLPEARRIMGDWYAIEPETAVRAVRWIAGGSS